MELLDSFKRLRNYCEQEQFMGWDPYDGLNSRVFQAIPFLKKSAICRLIVIQGFKRCPFNLRSLAMVPKEYNAKGIGLFLSGYCNLYKAVAASPDMANKIGTRDELKSRIYELAELLLKLRSKGYSGACWGYNFDWQARRLFLFPKFTPTVVATCFCAEALFEASEILDDERYRTVALSSADFIIKDLHRTPFKDGFLFSYSPLKGNDTVYNASLLGAKLLCLCYKYTGNKEYLQLAEQSVRACCAGQREDGAWIYGMLPVQNWVDSFHTGYNLNALAIYIEVSGDIKYQSYLDKGLKYYIDNFFESDGCPKYYDVKKYPIDIHCPGQLFVSLSGLNECNNNKNLITRVLNWTVRNMQDKKGYFYYQLKPGLSSKISYMRWSNAFMFNAFSHLIKNLEAIK